MKTDDSKIAGVVGDPALFSVAEHNAKTEIEELGLSISAITRVRWGKKMSRDRPASFSSPMIPGTARLFIWHDPPASAIKNAVKASETLANVFLVILIEADDYDRRSKILRDMEKKGQLHVVGFVRPHETARWNSVMRMVAAAENIDLSNAAISGLRNLDYTKTRPVRLKNGRFADRLTCDFQRVKREAIKAQMYAGYDQQITQNDIDAICIPDFSVESWDMIDAMMSGKVNETIKCLDALVSDLSDARRLLGLIRSQIELIITTRAVIEETINRDPPDIAFAIRNVRKEDHYDMWDGVEGISSPPIDQFRISKILEFRYKPIWLNCHMALQLCLQVHKDLVGPLGANWFPIMIRFCLDIAMLSSSYR